MRYKTGNEVIERLLQSYQRYFNIEKVEGTFENNGLNAICEYYERSQRYVMSKKAELWAANGEEFLYLYKMSELTPEVFEQIKSFTLEDGMARAHIGSGHMYTYITPVIVCDTCTDEARKQIKKCRIYKSFKFSLHGWMDFHAVVVDIDHDTVFTNLSGKSEGKVIKKIV